MVKIDNGFGGTANGNTVLEALEDARVFSIRKQEDGLFCIEEQCDRHFSGSLTKEQLLTLSKELRAMACQA